MIVPKLDQADRRLLSMAAVLAGMVTVLVLWAALIAGLAVRVFFAAAGIGG